MDNTKKSTEVEKYLTIVSAYDNEFKKWEARVRKILKRYRDDTRSSSGNDTAKFNILWSNVQTLIPAVYSKLPKADVSRRFGDHDQVGRVASLLIERALEFEIEHYPDFRATMQHAVEDRFLGGRGVAWVRYEPHVSTQDQPEDGLQVTEDTDEVGETSKVSGAEIEPQEQIEYECAPTDYVHWSDFGHSIARTWEEVTQVWRWVYMTKEALAERFGDEMAKKIPLDAGPDPLQSGVNQQKSYTRAKICELWCKDSGKVYWFSKTSPHMIDERDDPLDLDQFWPCARPLYATTTSDSLVPVPDFVLYQDQANELDILSDRIDGLVKALRVRGVYDASQPSLQRLLTEGDNNTLIPVDKWMAFSEKGGLKGSIDLLPLDTLSTALLQCYKARTEIKAQIYEITGLSDIIRGASIASETATAQQIKSQFASLRLRSMQEEVALFATDLLRLKAQIICTKFQPQTILMYAAAQQMNPADQQMIPQALELIKSNPLRNFRIEVAADSLVQLDEQQNKKDRNEFLMAFSGFLKEAIPAAQAVPEMTPMLVELMRFGIASFKGAAPIEGAIDQAMEQMKEKAKQPQPEKPDPEALKLQAQAQGDQMRVQADTQLEQMKQQFEAQKHQHQMEMDSQKAAQTEQFDRWKTEIEAATKVMVARIGANPGLDIPSLDAQQAASDRITAELSDDGKQALDRMSYMQDNMTSMQDNMANMHGQTTERFNQMLHILSSPKRIVRGPDGKAIGVEIIQ